MSNTLAIGVEADGKVLSLKENYSNFQNTRGNGETMYCHYMELLLDGGEEIKAQICMEQTRLEIFGVGEVIRFKVNNYTKGIHTIKLLSVYNRAAMSEPPAATPKDASAKTMRYSSLAGTDKELALRYAVQYFAARPEEGTTTVLKKADEFLVWLRKEN